MLGLRIDLIERKQLAGCAGNQPSCSLRWLASQRTREPLGI